MDVVLSNATGLFAGLALDGTILVERYDANRDFYGSNVSTTDILSGRVPAPEIASPMYDVIEAAEGLDESGLPDSAYVPGAHGESTSVPPANAAAAAHSGAAPSEGANPASKPVFDSAGAHS
ncbi:hypothetical protein A1Q2_04195 [Trichosporon asahii var. asahii CBS 8904]|uniref:Ysc84 actin-binding domain-containing protein n=2 Tax=Trichosporon asahii var. asahii TaxID=189963 RepID=K1VXD5_TRIAC|nr:hypothetical protein A1Q1_03397 [Trichosporon asahii var. asahii CBS 2479]EJT47732.1 hypothetical protein A1Q1_03397 [Trichosporon asahii var. asahii CBS 2479]EKD01493.1 hypothetical protein A1Q2_04195 [Trichosporon asahii var. asahii CBS 8904]